MQLENWIVNANSSILSDFGNSWAVLGLFKVRGGLVRLWRDKIFPSLERIAEGARPRFPGWFMSIEEAIAKDLVAVLFVTFLFGGGALWLIVATVAEQWRKFRVADRNAALKQSMVAAGFRPDEIVKVLNAGGGES